MNHKRLISLRVCFILSAVLGLPALSFAGNESETLAKAEQHFEKANELRKLANYDAAITEYNKVINLSPKSKIAQDAQYWIGQSHFRAGQFDAALSAFQKLLDEHSASTIIASTKLMMERVQQAKKNKSLFEAVKKGDVEQVRLLIAQGADVDAKDEDGQAPLHLAANRVYKGILELLIESGADIDAREDKWGNTALLNAAVRGQKEIVELLIEKGANIEAGDGNGLTPLHLTAAYSNHEDYMDIVKLLLDKGANIETRGYGDSTPLQAVAYVGRKEVAELLLGRGAKINADASKFFGTSTHQAMRGGQRNMVRWSISKGVDIPPMHQAAFFGEIDKVRSLLSKGTDVNQKDVAEYTPLHCAVLGRNREIVQLLLEDGADLEARDCASATPLFLACSQAYLDMVKVLVDNGAEVNSGAFKGLNWGPMHIDKDWTNLHTAALQGHVDVVKYLLSKGANIYARCTGLTALHFAAQGNKKGNIEIIECLLDKGIDVNMKDDEKRTALDHAKEKNRTKIVELLRKHGAKE